MKISKKQLLIILSVALLLLSTLTLYSCNKDTEERTVYYYGDFGYVIKDDGRLW